MRPYQPLALPIASWMRLSFAAVLGLVLLSSCESTAPVLDREAPELTVLEPFTGSTHPAGMPLPVCFHVVENDQLHGWEIIAINANTQRQVGYVHGHEHTRDLTVTDTLHLSGAFPLRLLIRADDHTGNTAEVVHYLDLVE